MKPLLMVGTIQGHQVTAGLDAEREAFGSPVVIEWIRQAISADRYVTPSFPWPKVKASLTEPLGFTCAMIELCDVDSIEFVTGRDQVPFKISDDAIV